MYSLNTLNKTIPKHITILLFIATLVVIISLSSSEDLNGDRNHENMKTPAPKLSSYERYKDFFRLTEHNFTKEVYSRKDAWVVIIHGGDTIPTSWKTMAASLRGMVWVGLVHKDEREIFDILMKTLSPDMQSNITLPMALIYPYGTKKTKSAHVASAATPMESRSLALRSIPDHLVKISGEDVQDFFMDSFAAVPSKFPALLITMDLTDTLYKCLALRFQRYFNFRKMVDPTTQDLAALGLQDVYINMPAFLLLTTTDPINPAVNAVIYNPEEMGEINYPNVMRFLFSVNAQFRYLLPGDNMSNNKEVANMEDAIEIEKARFDFVEGQPPPRKETEVQDESQHTMDIHFEL